MTPLGDKTALIIIDVQDGLDDPRLGKRNNPDAESNIARLLAKIQIPHSLFSTTRVLPSQRETPVIVETARERDYEL